MKPFLIATVLIVCLIAFKTDQLPNQAAVNQVQGIYIFTDCLPVKEYEYVGTVQAVYSGSGQYQPVRDKLVKKLKKEFPGADGAIFYFNNGSADRCDAIKLKP